MTIDFLQDALVILLNISILGAAGLGVQAAEVRAFLQTKRTLWLSVFANLGVLPLVAWASTSLLGTPAPIALGIMLAAAAPGGGTGLLLTSFAGGNLSYAVAMVFLFLLLGSVAVPLIIAAAYQQDIAFFGAMISNAVAFQVIPFAVGVWSQRHWNDAAKRWEKRLSRVGLVTLLILTVGLLVTKGHLIVHNGAGALSVMVLCSVVGFGTGVLVSGPLRNQAAFALSTGVRNLSLGILLAGLLFPDPQTMMAVLSYGLVMYLLSIPAVLLYRNAIKKQDRSPRNLDYLP